jgi:hypothetical protein
LRGRRRAIMGAMETAPLQSSSTLTRATLARGTSEAVTTRQITEALAGEKHRRQRDMLVARVWNAIPRLSDQFDGN